jgi:RNA polymerase sigma factor (sigma-70 family)
MDAAPESFERVYRQQATQIRAALAARTGDIGLAEDAVQDAFVEAMVHWPRAGVPANPGGWLATTARRKALDRLRRDKVGERKLALLAVTDPGGPAAAAGHAGDPLDAGGADLRADDELLSLVFACCHPALSRDAQVALTLRAVCGLTGEQIARAFLVSDATMSQRLLRARKTLADQESPVRVPDPDELADRLAQVLAVVYLFFNEGYLASSGREPARRDLAAQAIALTRTLHRLMPREPEVLGLLALLLLHESRAAARFDGWGRLIRLKDQDRSRWNRGLAAEATGLLDRAIAMRRPGPYQVQAAIAALHAEAGDYEQTDWRQIRLLYNRLQDLTPSPVVLLNRAVATRYALGPEEALAEIEPLRADLDGYHLFHALRAALLTALGRAAEATAANDRALSLAVNPAERDLLTRGLSLLPEGEHYRDRQPISMTGRTSTVIQPRSTPGQVLAMSTASSIESTSSTEYPPSTSLVSMYGPSVTTPARTVLAVAGPWSWAPPSESLPVAPHFSYQAPTSAYQAPYSGLSGAGSSGVSMISTTYLMRVSLSAPRPQRAPAPTPRTPAPRFRHPGRNFLTRPKLSSVGDANRRDLTSRPGQGTSVSWWAAANSRSDSVRSDSFTSRTRSTCRPTGHHWMRQRPSLIDLTDAPGIQIVVKRWPWRHRTTALRPRR